MDAREKLVELICRFCSGLAVSDITPPYGYENLADFLISNGVTVQEWIPVTERLPEFPGHYLVCTSINYWHGGCMDINENHKYHPSGTPVGYDGTTISALDCYYDVTGHWNRVCDSHVTHWMPLPTPPKGE